MGTIPVIRVKGMSRLQYEFHWDTEIRHYAYTPTDQQEIDDIFRTQGKLYKTMHFSVWLEEDPVKTQKSINDSWDKVEDKAALREICQKYGLETKKQDRPPAMRRLLDAYSSGFASAT